MKPPYDISPKLLEHIVSISEKIGLLKAGLAWHFRKYSKDEKLQALEDKARANKVGLWQDKNPIPPWYCRRGV